MGDPVDLGPQRDSLSPGALIRRRSLAVQNARACCDSSARANCDEVLEARVPRLDEDDGGGEIWGAGADAAGDDGHDQDVEGRGGGEGVCGQHALAEGGVEGVRGRGEHFGGDGLQGVGNQGEIHLVLPGEEIQGIEGAEDVDGLETAEDDHAEVDGYCGKFKL